MALIMCPKCGNEVPENANFCTNCGFPLTGTTSQNSNANAQDINYNQQSTPINMTEPKKAARLIERTWFLVAICVCFPIIGLILLWVAKRPHNVAVRTIISVLLAITMIYIYLLVLTKMKALLSRIQLKAQKLLILEMILLNSTTNLRLPQLKII